MDTGEAYQGRGGRGGWSGGGRSSGRGYQGQGYQGQGGYQGGYQQGGYNDGGWGGGGRGGGRSGGYYDGGRGGRGGGSGRGGYDGYQGQQGGGYQQQQQHYDGGRGGRGGGFYDNGRGGGGNWGRGGGRNWTGRGRPRPQQQQQQQQQLNLPSNLSEIKTIDAHTQSVTCMCFDPVSNMLFTGSRDGKVKQWNCQTGELVHEVDLHGQVDSVLYVQAGQGSFLFVGYLQGAPNARAHDCDGIINVFTIPSGRSQLLTGHRGHVNQLMAANSMLFSGGQDASIRVWGLEGELFTCKTILNAATGGHTVQVSAMEMVNNFLFTGDASGCVKIWDPASGQCTQTLQNAHASFVTRILQYGANVLTSSMDGCVKVWALMEPPAPGAVMSLQPVATPISEDEDGGRHRNRGPPNGIIAIDGTSDKTNNSILVVSRINDGYVTLYNVEENVELGCLPQTPKCRALTCIPGLAIIAGDDQGKVHIYSWL